MTSELTGKALGIAVAKEVMGWKEWRARELEIAVNSGDEELIASFYPFYVDPNPHDEWLDYLYVYEFDLTGEAMYEPYRRWSPLHSMDDVWEVDHEDWLWMVREHQMGVDVKLTVINPAGVYWATIEWEEGLSRKESWCVARLRAALKAVRGENDARE